jgi:hypothetical protein
MEAVSLSLEERYQRSESIVSRRIAGEAVLVPIRNQVGALDSIYALNETAALVWDSLDGTLSLRQALARVTAEFEVDEVTAAQDLLELVADLVRIGALEKV